MTAGTEQALSFNMILAEAANQRGWIFGIGSQRGQLLEDSNQRWREVESLREKYQDLMILGNLGLSEVITHPVQKIQDLVDSLGGERVDCSHQPFARVFSKRISCSFSRGLQSS